MRNVKYFEKKSFGIRKKNFGSDTVTETCTLVHISWQKAGFILAMAITEAKLNYL